MLYCLEAFLFCFIVMYAFGREKLVMLWKIMKITALVIVVIFLPPAIKYLTCKQIISPVIFLPFFQRQANDQTKKNHNA